MHRSWFCGLALLPLLLGSLPVSARKARVQIALLPAISWVPNSNGNTEVRRSPTGRAADLDGKPLGRFNQFGAGAGASLRVSFAAVPREVAAGFLWIQGGFVTNALQALPGDYATSASWTLLVGGTFRLNIDRLAFQDRSSRFGALFDVGLGLGGAQLVARSLSPPGVPSQPGSYYQTDFALIQGDLSLVIHLGVGLDYWLTRHLLIGIMAGWDIPAVRPPIFQLARYPSGSVSVAIENLGYLSVGPMLGLRF